MYDGNDVRLVVKVTSKLWWSEHHRRFDVVFIKTSNFYISGLLRIIVRSFAHGFAYLQLFLTHSVPEFLPQRESDEKDDVGFQLVYTALIFISTK